MTGTCDASGALSATHLDALAERPRILRQILDAGPELRCSLRQHTRPHMDVLHEGPAPGHALWARWPGDAVLSLPDCPAVAGGEGCGQYLSHPGGHTWQASAITGR
ncbi:hypothetical protein [Streptomyces sp. NPDC058401]|uniref:hypothetical protein n=1 Tax=Streptomyces sp. NPDC058401 TaxID=3346480 RepID=UPI00365BC9DA